MKLDIEISECQDCKCLIMGVGNERCVSCETIHNRGIAPDGDSFTALKNIVEAATAELTGRVNDLETARARLWEHVNQLENDLTTAQTMLDNFIDGELDDAEPDVENESDIIARVSSGEMSKVVDDVCTMIRTNAHELIMGNARHVASRIIARMIYMYGMRPSNDNR